MADQQLERRELADRHRARDHAEAAEDQRRDLGHEMVDQAAARGCEQSGSGTALGEAPRFGEFSGPAFEENRDRTGFREP